jgi:hypothetical protein
MTRNLTAAKLTAPDLEGQPLSARRALRELERPHDPLCRRERRRATGCHPAEHVPSKNPRRPRRRHLDLALMGRLNTQDHGL